jgi:hypothetical protein
MTNYLPYIFGLTFFIGGLYTFLLSFRLYTPKHKTEEQKEKFEIWLKKFGTIMKVCSIALILNGSYDLIIHDTDRYRIGSRQWTDADKLFLLNDLKKSKYIALYPQFADKACDCMVDNIVKNLSVVDYTKMMQLESNERFIQLRPFIQNCLDEFRKQTYSIDPPDKKGWTKQDRLYLINGLKTTSQLLIKYPQFADETCNCWADKIMESMDHDKYLEFTLLPENDQYEKLFPIVKSCTDTLNKRIADVEDKK